MSKPSDELDILIEADGTVRFVYDDRLAEVFEGEEATTVRASHVEPHGDGWTADMRPSGGPVLFANGAWDGGTWDHVAEPFKTRQQALDAEREWLRREKGL